MLLVIARTQAVGGNEIHEELIGGGVGVAQHQIHYQAFNAIDRLWLQEIDAALAAFRAAMLVRRMLAAPIGTVG